MTYREPQLFRIDHEERIDGKPDLRVIYVPYIIQDGKEPRPMTERERELHNAFAYRGYGPKVKPEEYERLWAAFADEATRA